MSRSHPVNFRYTSGKRPVTNSVTIFPLRMYYLCIIIYLNIICLKVYSKINSLLSQSHIYDVLPCSACDKTFETEEALNLHVAERHCNTWIRGKWRRQNKLTYDCPYCNRVYSTQSHLTRHISEIHEKKKEDQAELKVRIIYIRFLLLSKSIVIIKNYSNFQIFSAIYAISRQKNVTV